ncbi:MAG: NAD(P)-dependent oxidoreductase, partial [Roseicyclus sp.]
MKVLVLGATGGSGRAIVARLLGAGHDVTAFVRDPARMDAAPGLRIVAGDATVAGDVARAVPGQGAIVISLGQRPEPFAWLPGRGRAPAHLCETGTRHVLDAIPPGASPRLVVVSAYGVGDTRDTAPWYVRLYLRLFLGALMDDKERQEALLKARDLDYLLVQPVALTDGPATGT